MCKRMMMTALAVLLGMLALQPEVAQAQSAPDGFNPGANNPVQALAVQADGKILVGGEFTQLGGAIRNRIGRLNLDGTLDTTFNPGANNAVYAIAVQSDGRILVGGDFTSLAGTTRSRIGRLNPDGTLDTAFNPDANARVAAIAVQADGRILLGGSFTSLGGATRSRIGRVNSEGALEMAFNPGAEGTVNAIALQPDGKILVGGEFTQLGGQARSRIGRLDPEGALDTTFNPGANNSVEAFAIQTDGRILLGGSFTQLGGLARNRIGRLDAQGALDATFSPSANNAVFALAVQADGRILVGGSFIQLAGSTRNRIGRFDPNGVLDSTFNPVVNGPVFTLALQTDGKILLGGEFTQIGGQTRNSIGRVTNGSDPVATVSAASFRQAEPLAAESIVAAFGTGLALGQEAANTSPLPLTLLGTSVQVRDSAGVLRTAPLFFVSPGQINYLIPEDTAPGEATVSMTSGDGQISSGTIQITTISLGLFSANSNGTGVAAAQALRVTATGAQIFEEVAQLDAGSNTFVARCISLGPVEESVFLVLYGTGIRGITSISGVTATIGGADIPVLFAGAQGSFIGLDQINLGPIPRELIGRGTADVVVTVNGQRANVVQICIN